MNPSVFKGFIDVGKKLAAVMIEDQDSNTLEFQWISSISEEGGFVTRPSGIHDQDDSQ